MHACITRLGVLYITEVLEQFIFMTCIIMYYILIHLQACMGLICIISDQSSGFTILLCKQAVIEIATHFLERKNLIKGSTWFTQT